MDSTSPLQTTPPEAPAGAPVVVQNLVTQQAPMPRAHQVLTPRLPTEAPSIGQNSTYRRVRLFPCDDTSIGPPTLRAETVLVIRAWGRHNDWCSVLHENEYRLQEFVVRTHGHESVCRQVFAAVQTLVGGTSKYNHDQAKAKLSLWEDRSDPNKGVIAYRMSFLEWRATGLQFARYTTHPLTKTNETARRVLENAGVVVAAVGLYAGAKVGSKLLTDKLDARAMELEEKRLLEVQKEIKNEISSYTNEDGRCKTFTLDAAARNGVAEKFKLLAPRIRSPLDNLSAKFEKKLEIPGMFRADKLGVSEFFKSYLVAKETIPVHLHMMCALQTLDYQPVAALAASGPMMTKLLQRSAKYMDAAHRVLLKRVFDEAQASDATDFIAKIKQKVDIDIETKAFKAGSVNQVHKSTDGKHVFKFVKPSVETLFACEKAMYEAQSECKCAYLDDLIADIQTEIDLETEYRNWQEAKMHYKDWQLPAMEYVGDLKVLKMEFVPGDTLKAVMATPGNTERCREIKQNLAGPLQNWFNVLFKNGFAHADLHEGNIMIDKDNNPWMIDFGLCVTLTDREALRRYAVIAKNVVLAKKLRAASLAVGMATSNVSSTAFVVSGASTKLTEALTYPRFQKMYSLTETKVPDEYSGVTNKDAVTTINKFFELNSSALKRDHAGVWKTTMEIQSAVKAVHGVVKLYNGCASLTDSSDAEIDSFLNTGASN